MRHLSLIVFTLVGVAIAVGGVAVGLLIAYVAGVGVKTVTVVQTPERESGCGVERAAVKHLTDGYTLGKAHADTIGHLVHLDVPPVEPSSGRFTEWRGPGRLPEGRLIQFTNAHVVAAKQEADSDLHIIVRDDAGDEMNVEAPQARCDSSSPYAARLAVARQHIDAAFPHVSSYRYTSVDVHALIRGTVFYDVLHGQRGAANGVELHPVTLFKVLP